MARDDVEAAYFALLRARDDPIKDSVANLTVAVLGD